MRTRLLALAALLLVQAPFAHAQMPGTVIIGVLNDMAGPFADQSGKGSVIAAQMVAEDFVAEGAASSG
jgi:branched-chain amino acid transport system substrate-binding protein